MLSRDGIDKLWMKSKDIYEFAKLIEALARKPLTDEEIERLLFESHRKPGSHRHNFARLIERAHGIGGEE